MKDEGRLHSAPATTTNISAQSLALPAGALRVIEGALSRTVVIREAIEDGDYGYAAHVAEDLEHDLAGDLHRLRVAA